MEKLKIKFDLDENKVILNRNPVTKEETEAVNQAREGMALRRWIKGIDKAR